jgi:hypothetical protein
VKRFVVAIDGETKERSEAFLAWLKANEFGWWHWVPNVWLLVTLDDYMSSDQIRNMCREQFGDLTNLVFEVPPGNCAWAGIGRKKTKDTPGTFDWVDETWNQ